MATESANPLAAGDTAALYRAAIGPRGQDYYLRQFARFDAAGRTGASWHWPAYWSTLNWLIYRKMWGQALAYLAAVLGMALLVFGVGKLLLSYDDTTGLLLFLAFLTAAFVVPGLYANAWYYNFCNEKISAALRATPEVKDAAELLTAQAATTRRFFGQAAANVALMALLGGVLTFMLNPAQHMMQLAQRSGDAAPPLLPEMAGGTLPVMAPASTGATEVRTEEARAESPPAGPAPAEVAAVPAPKTEPPVEPKTAESAATPDAEPAPVLTSAAKIDDYLARLTGTPPEPAVERAPPTRLAQADAAPARPAAAPARRPAPTRTAQLAAAGTEPSVSPPASRPARSAAVKTEPQKPAKTKKSWYVQAGAFAQEGNAQNVRLRIEAAGLETSTAPYETPAGRLIRVRVGPYAAKADAEQAALRVKALDLPAVLFKE